MTWMDNRVSSVSGGRKKYANNLIKTKSLDRFLIGPEMQLLIYNVSPTSKYSQ